jgi:hypothetical protein
MIRKDGLDRFRGGLIRILKIMGSDRVALGARYLRKRSDNEIRRWEEALAVDAGVSANGIKIYGVSQYANWSHFDVSQPLPLDAEWLPLSAIPHSVLCRL